MKKKLLLLTLVGLITSCSAPSVSLSEAVNKAKDIYENISSNDFDYFHYDSKVVTKVNEANLSTSFQENISFTYCLEDLYCVSEVTYSKFKSLDKNDEEFTPYNIWIYVLEGSLYKVDDFKKIYTKTSFKSEEKVSAFYKAVFSIDNDNPIKKSSNVLATLIDSYAKNQNDSLLTDSYPNATISYSSNGKGSLNIEVTESDNSDATNSYAKKTKYCFSDFLLNSISYDNAYKLDDSYISEKTITKFSYENNYSKSYPNLEDYTEVVY